MRFVQIRQIIFLWQGHKVFSTTLKNCSFRHMKKKFVWAADWFIISYNRKGSKYSASTEETNARERIANKYQSNRSDRYSDRKSIQGKKNYIYRQWISFAYAWYYTFTLTSFSFLSLRTLFSGIIRKHMEPLQFDDFLKLLYRGVRMLKTLIWADFH